VAIPITPAAAMPPSHAIAPAEITAVASLPVGRSRGPLSGVPGYPPGHVARGALARLIELVVAADADGGAVGITGQAPALGWHGQGGIGKSVMATALARDEPAGQLPREGNCLAQVSTNLLTILLCRLSLGAIASPIVVHSTVRR
jgi:hypothetical protein